MRLMSEALKRELLLTVQDWIEDPGLLKGSSSDRELSNFDRDIDHLMLAVRMETEQEVKR